MGSNDAPKSRSTWFTLSIRNVSLPCSNSRTNRSPTPDFILTSSCVNPNSFRLVLTYIANVVISLHPSGYNLYLYTAKTSPFGYNFKQFYSFYTLSGAKLRFFFDITKFLSQNLHLTSHFSAFCHLIPLFSVSIRPNFHDFLSIPCTCQKIVVSLQRISK